jgi:Leucine-rich repeat (LRR) protein
LLYLSNCRQLEDITALRSCRKLETLYLQRCQLTDLSIQSLSSLTVLEYLCLQECTSITDRGIQSLSSLTALTYLELDGCTSISEVLRDQQMKVAQKRLTLQNAAN